MKRWTLRRLGPDPDDGSGADMVRMVVFVVCLCVCCRYVVIDTDVCIIYVGCVLLSFEIVVGCCEIFGVPSCRFSV